MPANAATLSPATASADQCELTKASSTVVNHPAVTHDETTTTPGTDEVSHIEKRWSREVSGSYEVSHLEYQFTRVRSDSYLGKITEYMAQDGSATTDSASAGWFTQSSYAGWTQFGTPKKVITQDGTSGHTEYYVSGGQPTLELGDSNWTTDSPEGWTFVDDRKVIDSEAVPPQDVVTTVTDSEAWDETVKVAATYGTCSADKLAATGVDDDIAFLSALLLVAAGVTTIILVRRRKRAKDARKALITE